MPLADSTPMAGSRRVEPADGDLPAHDGLVGDAFLRNLVVTYDLAASRLLVA